jgi:hypothetical protein
MARTYFYLLGATLLVAATAATAAEQRPFPIIQGDFQSPLTLVAAQRIVTQSFLSSGRRGLRAGRAEFDGNGNVLVEVVSIQGLPFGHVLVDGQTRQVVAIKSHGGGNRG